MQTRLELYQLVAPLAGLGTWERNLTTGAIYWNRIVRQILEVDSEYIPRPDTSLLFYKEPDRVRRMLSDAITKMEPQHAELELFTARGALKWVKIRMNVRSAQNEDRLLYGTVEDITHEVQTRHLLEERELRFTNAFDHAPIGMALVSLVGTWLKVNRSLCNLLGLEEHDLINHTFQQLTHPDDLEADLDQMENLVKGKIGEYSMEKRYFHKNGHIIWALLNVSLVRNESGMPLYFISQIKDITQRRKNAEIIKAQNARLLNFAHIVSHNLRSHAGNIKMLSSMVATEQDPAEQSLLLGMLNQNADNLLETLSQLNEVVNVHNKGLDDRKNLYLDMELRRVIQMLGASILQQDVKLEIDISSNLMILFNPAYLENIFVNLFTNSMRYRHPDRSPWIRISAREDSSKVIIEFSDNGLGIDLELHRSKLFGMYKTFHGNTDARGLGLFLVKNQVEAMGGLISAESVPGMGMTFIIETNKH